jgi:hypothetical protein
MLLPAAPTTSFGGVITVPPGLPVGSTYYLVFDTAYHSQADYPLIVGYNIFVDRVANNVGPYSGSFIAGLSTWKAIASTASTSAADNIGIINAPIYNLYGQEVAANSAALWSTATTPLLNPIDVDETGKINPDATWTGTNSDGSSSSYCLGCAGTIGPAVGIPIETDFQWIDHHNDPSELDTEALYAISGPLVVVPEPNPMATLMWGALLLVSAGTRRNRTSCEPDRFYLRCG